MEQKSNEKIQYLLCILISYILQEKKEKKKLVFTVPAVFPLRVMHFPYVASLHVKMHEFLLNFPPPNSLQPSRFVANQHKT